MEHTDTSATSAGSDRDVLQTGDDVVSYLRAQHERVKSLFASVLANRGEERARLFYELRRLLAVHETAEEQIVHPIARRVLDRGAEVVDARLLEENDAKKLLADVEDLDPDSTAFEASLRLLQTRVLAHAEAEEAEEFAELAAHVDAGRLADMRKIAELAEAVAPTRPHPGVESALANTLVGPFASMLDRVRDAIAGKR